MIVSKAEISMFKGKYDKDCTLILQNEEGKIVTLNIDLQKAETIKKVFGIDIDVIPF